MMIVVFLFFDKSIKYSQMLDKTERLQYSIYELHSQHTYLK